MSEHKHTPGWEWEEDFDSYCGSYCTPDGCLENHPSGTYRVNGPEWNEDADPCLDSRDHARLIAAAPELLAALEMVDRVAMEDCHHFFTGEQFRQLRAAIAKATGGIG